MMCKFFHTLALGSVLIITWACGPKKIVWYLFSRISSGGVEKAIAKGGVVYPYWFHCRTIVGYMPCNVDKSIKTPHQKPQGGSNSDWDRLFPSESYPPLDCEV